MTDYIGTIIEYLESYRPGLYAELRESGGLRQWLEDQLEALGQAEDAIARSLAAEHPEMSDTQIRLQAEEEAIRQVLPIPDDEAEQGDGDA